MGLFAVLGVVFLISTTFGQSIGDVWEGDQDSKMAAQSAALFNKVKYGTIDHGKSDDPAESSKDDKLLQGRIVGGSEALYGEIPWQASVKRHLGGQFIHHCGAVVIGEYWLLSAAHCFSGTAPEMWRVMVGEHHLNRKDPGEQEFEIEALYTHEQYSGPPHDYDFALIKVKPSRQGRGIQFNEYVQPIRLPYSNALLTDGTKLLVSGWGYTTTESPQVISNVLKKAIVPVVNQEKCKQMYPGQITARMVCAGYVDGGTDSCRMDSGGPLAYIDGGHYVLYGIVSWGRGCAQPNSPGIYARVTAFLPWIEDIIQSDS